MCNRPEGIHARQQYQLNNTWVHEWNNWVKNRHDMHINWKTHEYMNGTIEWIPTNKESLRSGHTDGRCTTWWTQAWHISPIFNWTRTLETRPNAKNKLVKAAWSQQAHVQAVRHWLCKRAGDSLIYQQRIKRFMRFIQSQQSSHRNIPNCSQYWHTPWCSPFGMGNRAGGIHARRQDGLVQSGPAQKGGRTHFGNWTDINKI